MSHAELLKQFTKALLRGLLAATRLAAGLVWLVSWRPAASSPTTRNPLRSAFGASPAVGGVWPAGGAPPAGQTPQKTRKPRRGEESEQGSEELPGMTHGLRNGEPLAASSPGKSGMRKSNACWDHSGWLISRC